MEREISYSEALDKVGDNGLLQIDPDKVSHILTEVAENRRQLKPLRDQWQSAEMKEVLQEYTPDDPTRLPTPPWMNGEAGEDFGEEDIDEWFGEQDFDRGDYSGFEFQVGQELTDPAAAMAEINRRVNETQTVSLATVSMEDILEIDGVSKDDWDSIDRWSFMIKQENG